MTVLTRGQISSFEKAIAICNQVLPRLEMLEKLGLVNQALYARVTELRTKRDYLHAMAETALEFHHQMERASRG